MISLPDIRISICHVYILLNLEQQFYVVPLCGLFLLNNEVQVKYSLITQM